MKLSIIIYLPTQAAFPLSYLYQSLQQQTLTDIETLIYHAPGLEIPESIKAWATVEPLANDAYASSAWKAGLAKAKGEAVALIQNSVQFESLHFELACAKLENSQADALAFKARYLDQEALPTRIQLPDLKANDWLGFCLSSRLLWPIESMIFKKSALSPADLPEDKQDLSACDLQDWLQAHAVVSENISSLAVAYADFHLQTIDDSRKHWLEQQLETRSPEELTPTYALSDAGSTVEQHLFISQALRNQGLWELANTYRARHSDLQQRVMLWFSTNLERDLPYLNALQADGWLPMLMQFNQEPSLSGGLNFTYTQSQGIAKIDVFGISSISSEPHANQLNPLENQILDITEQILPAAIHFTGFDVVNYRLPVALSANRTPIYISIFDDQLFQTREQLRYSETLSEYALDNDLPALIKNFHLANNYLEHLFQNVFSRIFAHGSEIKQAIKRFGLNEKQVDLIETADALATAYRELPIFIDTQKKNVDLGIFEAYFQQNFEDHLKSDLDKFESEQRVLIAGHNISQLTQDLNARGVPTQGASFSQSQSKVAQQQGQPVFSANINKLSPFVHTFDRVYTPYLLETLSFQDLKHLVSTIVLNLKKQGYWILRCLDPDQLNSNFKGFWLHQNQRRPYSPLLLKAILEHAGFEVEETELGGIPWKSNTFKSRLKTEGLPLVNFPITTEGYKDYWEAHPPQIDLQDDDQVLIVGSHIFKTWLIYRVQCAFLMGISLNLNEFTKRPKTSEKYQFRHSSAIEKTLKGLQKKYDVIILQGVIETLSPPQAREAIKACNQLLTEKGRLQIETLQITPEEDPLFWQSALNVRPYPELSPLLNQAGFKPVEQRASDQHTVYLCEKGSVEAAALAPTDLPDIAMELAKPGTKKLEINAISQLRNLSESDYDFIFVDAILEQLPPRLLPNALQKIANLLKYNGRLAVRFHDATPDIWSQPEVQRPYPSALIQVLLHETGLQKSHLEQVDQYFIWTGFKRLQIQKPRSDRFKLLLEGDVFNYHSLATVNRALLSHWISDKSLQLEVRNFLDPDFAPDSDSPDFKIYQAHERSLLDQPNLTLRHAWPPEFNAPNSLGHWVIIQPWEYGSIPVNWIYNMNKFVDQVWVPSAFVKQCYLDSGILEDKIAVVPNGVDVDLYKPSDTKLKLATTKKFKFLFVGGGIKRKGIDLLMNAFAECFSAKDDVCLVIKEFGAGIYYDDMDTKEWLERHRKNNPEGPEFLHLTEHLSESEMPALYNACDALVHPYRGEGFAMPVAEAMACEKAVIVTNYGACLDFCNETNAYLIPMEVKRFAEKKVDEFLTVDYPHWAEPDYEALKALLLEVYNQPQTAQIKAKAARESIVKGFTWKHALTKLKQQIKELENRPVFRLSRDAILARLLGEAFSAIDAQNFELAVTKFERALQMDPYQPSVYYNLGVAYLMLENFDKSLEALTRSLREGEITGDLCYAMATVLRHLGDQETSQDFYDKARELNPDLFAMA